MKLEINGRIVEVDDSFANLPPDQQQKTVESIAAQLSAQPGFVSQMADKLGVSAQDPLLWGGVGTVGGLALGPMVTEAGRRALQGPAAPGIGAVDPRAPGQKYIAKTGYGAGPGETVREVVDELKARQAPIGEGKISKTITKDKPLTIADYQAQKAREEMEARMRAKNAPFSQKLPPSAQTAVRAAEGAASKFPAWMARGAAGASTGFQAADMINRLREGDVSGGVISGLGALGSVLSFIPHPITRIGGTALAAGAPLLLSAMEDKEEEKKAAGGAIKGYATGEKVVKAVKGGLDLAVGKEPASIKNLKNQITPLWERFGYDPKKIAQQYPDVLPPTLEIDKKTGKQYLAKQLSPEALAVQKARQAAQKEIDTGSPLYQPYFDITKRSYVNPADYPLSERTLDLTMPKKADTLAKHRAMAQSPEATARLESAYDAAAGSPTAHGFYMMKQLQDEYIKEYGPELGRLAFKRDFADPMAATTGGQTPTANLMMTAMHNYFANKGMPMPSKGYEIPYPVGGNKLQSNIDMSQKLFNTGSLPAADSPKRFNFSSNFLGHSDRPTIDEQMMGLFNPGGKGAPDWYGVNEEAVNILSKLRGVEPVNYQEVAWAGAKGYPGQPMIEDVNQMIYRTHRITGEPQKDVLRRFIRREGPMYGITGLGALQATDGVNNPE